MGLLDDHLEQISLSAKAIADLPCGFYYLLMTIPDASSFPPPKIFTNALLGNHEITNLIRDTEPHERALFSIDPNAANGAFSQRSARRATVFPRKDNGILGRKSIYPSQETRQQSAVARVLGGEMLQEIQQSNRHVTSQRNGGVNGVNVEVLLRGAEKLCAVYPVVGAAEKIASLRNRYRAIAESIAIYEEKVSKQQSKLERMNKSSDFGSHSQDEDGDYEEQGMHQAEEPSVTEEDLRFEVQEVRELELKKRSLEERVTGMEKDLGGLLR